MQTGKCPNCPNTFPIDSRVYGKKVKCNSCGHVFIVADPAWAQSTAHRPDAEPASQAPFGATASRQPLPPVLPSTVDSPSHSFPPLPRGPAPKPKGSEINVAIAIVSVVVGVSWLLSRESGTSSGGSSRSRSSYSIEQAQPRDYVGQARPRTSGHATYADADAIRDIKAERTRYASQQQSALAAERSALAASQRSETQENRAQRESIRSEIQRCRRKLSTGALRKPSEPLLLSSSELTRQNVLDFIRDYRKWSEDRMALRREIFALEDEEGRLTAGESYRAYFSPLSNLSEEIRWHGMAKPHLSIAFGDADVQEYRRAVHAVQLQQWQIESELLEARRDALANATKATPARPPLGASAVADVASGPWRVERIVDGDTIEVAVGYTDHNEKVRLLNINTPEEGQTGYYEATAALRSLLEFRTVELEFEKPGAPTRDRYGRVLAFVFVSDTLVNYEMVKRGWSDFYIDYGRGRYALPIEFAEADARANRRGLYR